MASLRNGRRNGEGALCSVEQVVERVQLLVLEPDGHHRDTQCVDGPAVDRGAHRDARIGEGAVDDDCEAAPASPREPRYVGGIVGGGEGGEDDHWFPRLAAGAPGAQFERAPARGDSGDGAQRGCGTIERVVERLGRLGSEIAEVYGRVEAVCHDAHGLADGRGGQ